MRYILLFSSRSIAVWLLLIYVVSLFRVWQPYLDYKLNYSYISSILCENKNKPYLHCNGKCYLDKQLKKAAKEESEKQASSSSSYEVNEITTPQVVYFFAAFGNVLVKVYPQYIEHFSSRYTDHSVPPPKV